MIGLYTVQKYFYSQNNICFFLHYCIGISWQHFFIWYLCIALNIILTNIFLLESTNKHFSLQNMIEVRVPNLDCEGCASKLKKALFKLKGTFLHKKFCVFFLLFFLFGAPFHFLEALDWAGRHGPLKGNSCVMCCLSLHFIWALISKVPTCIPHLLCKCRTTSQEFGTPYHSGVHADLPVASWAPYFFRHVFQSNKLGGSSVTP